MEVQKAWRAFLRKRKVLFQGRLFFGCVFVPPCTCDQRPPAPPPWYACMQSKVEQQCAALSRALGRAEKGVQGTRAALTEAAAAQAAEEANNEVCACKHMAGCLHESVHADVCLSDCSVAGMPGWLHGLASTLEEAVGGLLSSSLASTPHMCTFRSSKIYLLCALHSVKITPHARVCPFPASTHAHKHSREHSSALQAMRVRLIDFHNKIDAYKAKEAAMAHALARKGMKPEVSHAHGRAPCSKDNQAKSFCRRIAWCWDTQTCQPGNPPWSCPA